MARINPLSRRARYERANRRARRLEATLGLGRAVVLNPPVRRGSADNGEGGALVAAGHKIQKRDRDAIRRLLQPWQTRSFAYYNLLGEIKYAAQFYSRALSNLELYPAFKEENGEIVQTDDPVAKAALERIQDPGGGRSGLLGTYGRLMFLTGEAYLLVTQPKDEPEQWEMLSSNELRIIGDTIMRIRAPSLLAEDLKEVGDDDYAPLDDKTAVAYRLWRRHPEYSQLADSTMQGVLDLCEELVLLTQAVRARARSRLAGSGILLISDVFNQAPLEPVGDEDPAEDPFLARLTEAMMAPLEDEGTSSAVVPLVVRVPGGLDVKAVMEHIQIVDPTQLYPETGLRRECIERIAIGLDMPPEILLGMQDSNHWTAWQIDEQTWKGHLQAVAQGLVDDLTSAYYRPQLKEAGLENWDRYSIAYDATAIINHPNRSADAKDLFDREAISKKALRESNGFDEDDAMPQEELNERWGLKIRDGGMITTGLPTLKSGSEVEVAPGEIEAPPVPGGGVETAPVPSSPETEKVPPATPTSPPVSDQEGVTGASNGVAAEVMIGRLLAAAELGVLRAREIAGNRLRSLARRDPEAAALIDGVPARQVAHVLGHERAKALGAGTAAELVASSHSLIVDALRQWGLHDTDSQRIAARIEQHAARTLYDEGPTGFPTSFVNYVRTAARR